MYYCIGIRNVKRNTLFQEAHHLFFINISCTSCPLYRIPYLIHCMIFWVVLIVLLRKLMFLTYKFIVRMELFLLFKSVCFTCYTNKVREVLSMRLINLLDLSITDDSMENIKNIACKIIFADNLANM